MKFRVAGKISQLELTNFSGYFLTLVSYHIYTYTYTHNCLQIINIQLRMSRHGPQLFYIVFSRYAKLCEVKRFTKIFYVVSNFLIKKSSRAQILFNSFLPSWGTLVLFVMVFVSTLSSDTCFAFYSTSKNCLHSQLGIEFGLS